MHTFDESYFDAGLDRRGTRCEKWDGTEKESVLPLWVADMDFPSPPEVAEAIAVRALHPTYGYTLVLPDDTRALTGFWQRRHNLTIQDEWVMMIPCVVTGIRLALLALTKPGDGVMIQSPVYGPFRFSVEATERRLMDAPLKRDDTGRYSMDLDAVEKQLQAGAKALVLCNPHNPVGRVWTREELRRLGEICLRHGVRVVADEIHCELTYEGHDYTPFASLSDDFLHGSVTCNSPSKAFNLAGMQIANIVSADADVRTGIDRAINDNEVCDVNPFGVEALMAAYDRGEEWLDRLREYLADNYRMLCGFFAEYLPQYPVLPLEGTYLVWIDCRTTGVSSEQIAARLLAEAKLMISPGTIYGPGGEDFIRLNIACPGSLLEEGLLRLRKVLGR